MKKERKMNEVGKDAPLPSTLLDHLQWLESTQTRALEEIDLSRNPLTCVGVRALVDRIIRHPGGTVKTIRSLDLTAVELGDDGCQAISKLLAEAEALESLYLGGNRIKCDGIVAICQPLHANSSLRVLELQNNSIGEIGAGAIGEVLKSNRSAFRTLFLWSNTKFGVQGWQRLSNGLASNVSGVRELRFSRMNVQCEDCAFIAKALAKNRTVTTLDLSQNMIADDGAAAISESLKKNKTLTSIDLRCNDVSEFGFCF